jgi:hypothetical protein
MAFGCLDLVPYHHLLLVVHRESSGRTQNAEDVYNNHLENGLGYLVEREDVGERVGEERPWGHTRFTLHASRFALRFPRCTDTRIHSMQPYGSQVTQESRRKKTQKRGWCPLRASEPARLSGRLPVASGRRADELAVHCALHWHLVNPIWDAIASTGQSLSTTKRPQSSPNLRRPRHAAAEEGCQLTHKGPIRRCARHHHASQRLPLRLSASQ